MTSDLGKPISYREPEFELNKKLDYDDQNPSNNKYEKLVTIKTRILWTTARVVPMNNGRVKSFNILCNKV